MIGSLSDAAAIALSTMAWPLTSAAVGRTAHGWSVARVSVSGPLTRLRAWERSGRWWVRHLRVQRWKQALPEAGALFGGYAKSHLRSRRSPDLQRFRAETIRAERVHWLIGLSGPLHLLWCRPVLGACMVAFGIAFSAPFIVVQRANRGALERILARR